LTGKVRILAKNVSLEVNVKGGMNGVDTLKAIKAMDPAVWNVRKEGRDR